MHACVMFICCNFWVLAHVMHQILTCAAAVSAGAWAAAVVAGCLSERQHCRFGCAAPAASLCACFDLQDCQMWVCKL